MREKKERATWKETLQLHLRCIREMYRLFPARIWSMILHDFFFSCHPYVTVYLSERIINELAGARRPDVLVRWVIITLVTEAVVGILRHILHNWEYKEWHYSYRAQDKILYSEKMMSMDYRDVDKQETHDLLAQIEQFERSGNWGFNRALYFMDVMFSAVVGIIGAVTLTVSLFTLPVPDSGGAWTTLNHPGVIALLIAILGLAVTISAVTEIHAVRTWSEINEDMRFGNRCFRVYGSFCAKRKYAADIRMYNQQEIAKRYLEETDTYGVNGKLAKAERGRIGVFSAVSESFSSLFTGCVYLFVALKAWAGAFGVGSVTQYVGAFNTLSWHVSRLIQSFGNMRSNTPFLRDTYAFLDIPNAMYQGSLPTEKRSDREYDVEFRDVSFRYPGTESWALRHVNMKFKVGSRLAVVGENGSGKTTFIKLLCRLYDPQEGQILLNGIDIRKYNYRDYMDVFAVVFQDFQLLSQPLGANVAGRMDYDADRVKRCLIDAGFGDRLESLPDGLNTQLYKEFGKGGVEVSGGEAQKIAIARALYKDAPFIILDEPTASLDPIAEAEIYAKFNDISGDKTSIYISHRLSSCKFCDEIAVFHEGSVIQQGTHEGLLADVTGKYHELWHAQAQYYTEKTA